MFRSLSWRAAAAFLLLLVTLFLVLGFVLSDRARDSAEHDLVQRAFTEAKGLASAATVLPANGLTPGSLDAVERIALSTDSVGLVLLANGAPVYGTPPNGDPLTYRLPEFQGALAGQPTQTVRTDPATGTKLLYSAVPITRGGSVVAAARVSVPRDSVGAAQAATWRRLGIAFGIAAIIGGLLHLWLIAPVSRTVRSLGEVTKHLAGGQLYERAGEPAYSEADGLAAAINDMAASLEQQVTQSYRERDTFGAVIDGMTEGLLVIDEKGAVSLANPAAAKLFAPDGQPMNGKRLMEVVRDHEIARVANEALAQTRQKTVDVMFGRELRPLRVTVTPLKERSGISALLIVQDMTEIHRLENVRREFVANVSHELRTPLASIKAAADALERGAIDDKTLARDFLERINVEVDHVTGLVQSLLDLSRMETGRANFEMKSVDIRALAKETAERLLPQAEKKGLALTAEMPETLPLVTADKQAIAGVILNLVENAIKFTERGSVTLSARPADGLVEVAVRDTGPGIDPKDLPHVFERFYKADRSRSSPGAGLGLALAKHAVQSHGGRIWVESEPSKGSTFKFTLPVAK